MVIPQVITADFAFVTALQTFNLHVVIRSSAQTVTPAQLSACQFLFFFAFAVPTANFFTTAFY
jgi:hypothetical protein